MSEGDICSEILIGRKTGICRKCKDFRRFLEGMGAYIRGCSGDFWGHGFLS